MNLTRCTSHDHNPPITDMAGARHWAGRMASLSIPGALTDFLSYRYPDPCCAAGAFAFYLGQAAMRESLAGDGPSWSPPTSRPGPVTRAIDADRRVFTDPTRPLLAAMRARAAAGLILDSRDDLAAYVTAAGLRMASTEDEPTAPAPAIPNDITSGIAAIAAVTARFPDLRVKSCDAMPYLPGHPCQATYTLTAGVRMATEGE